MFTFKLHDMVMPVDNYNETIDKNGNINMNVSSNNITAIPLAEIRRAIRAGNMEMSIETEDGDVVWASSNGYRFSSASVNHSVSGSFFNVNCEAVDNEEDAVVTDEIVTAGD